MIVDFTRHDLHRLDDARRARRRGQAAADERRPALARLQRPQHHEDLRDHRSRSRLHHLPDADEAVEQIDASLTSVVEPTERTRALGDTRGLALVTAGWDRRHRPQAGDAANGKKLFRRSAARATRSPTPERRGRSARTSTTRSRGRAQRLRRVDDPQRRPRPDPLPGDEPVRRHHGPNGTSSAPRHARKARHRRDAKDVAGLRGLRRRRAAGGATTGGPRPPRLRRPRRPRRHRRRRPPDDDDHRRRRRSALVARASRCSRPPAASAATR